MEYRLRALKGYEPAHGNVDVDSAEPLNRSPNEYQRYNLFSPAEWLIELITSLAGLLLLIAMAAVFWSMNGKPLSAWPGPVSLNTVVSILSTACTAALMHGVSAFIGQLKWLQFKQEPQKLSHFEKFDEASRGPWGSAVFLTTVKWNLATLGAAITILRLAFGPLAQQVVGIEQRNVTASNDQISFGYTTVYNRNLVGQGIGNSGLSSRPQDAAMQSAILQGLYNITVPEIFRCTGSCRWKGSYVSLGFKTDCNNVTQATLNTASCGSEPNLPSSNNCNMTTPGGIDIATRFIFTQSATTYYMNTTFDDSLWDTPKGLPRILQTAIYRATVDSNFNSSHVNVTECSLSLAAYRYTNASADGNEFSFGQVEEIDFELGSWGVSDGPLTFRVNASQTLDTPTMEISSIDLGALANFFSSNVVVSQWVAGNFENHGFGVSAALSGDVDIPGRFQKMATSMTSYLRSRPDSKLALGETLTPTPFVVIHWPFMLGPVVIEVAAILFAICTIIQNRRSRKVPLWKSLALPVLECQYDDQFGLIHSEVKDIKEMKKTAETATVRLE
ncbi:hypothetical protein VHEMI07685 [[Torrubiella] hemipterigena]|uniref:Uncharacterized protein n=1 Tax=[Torrubiella] hemipterigena TaxID=1531966 RepID=A0A0A1TB44_9HYPO|nr:hypothetical protein VHEMI07685 [[Torrubiella] hemipterigena]